MTTFFKNAQDVSIEQDFKLPPEGFICQARVQYKEGGYSCDSFPRDGTIFTRASKTNSLYLNLTFPLINCEYEGTIVFHTLMLEGAGVPMAEVFLKRLLASVFKIADYSAPKVNTLNSFNDIVNRIATIEIKHELYENKTSCKIKRVLLPTDKGYISPTSSTEADQRSTADDNIPF